MAKSKPPRKQYKPPVQRFTTTPFSTVMIRAHVAVAQLDGDSGLDLTQFHRLVMAWRVTDRLKLSEAEDDHLGKLGGILASMSLAYRKTSSTRLTGLPAEELQAVIEGLNTMQSIWDRYPQAHLERCYDAVFKEAMEKAETVIAGREESYG